MAGSYENQQDFRAFVINLPKDAERRKTMQERADSIGLGVEFFPAINGRELTREQAALYDGEKRKKYFGRDLSPGEIGCLLSHRAVCEKIVNDKIPVALILEDDVIFENDAMDVFRALTKTFVKWDVIRFLGSKKIYKRGYRIICPLTGKYSFARLPTTPGGAYAYMVTLAAAETMLKHMGRNWLPVDTIHGRCWRTGLETLIIYPAVLRADDVVESTIGDKRFDKSMELRGADKALFPLRRAVFKLEEAVGKKYVFLSSFFRDRFSH